MAGGLGVGMLGRWVSLWGGACKGMSRFLGWNTLLVAQQVALASLQAAPAANKAACVHAPAPAGAAIELLSYMCVTPLFYHRLMLHDASGAAPLRLVLVSM